MESVALTGLVGLFLLYAGGEALVRGASSLAARMRISPLVIGLTVVAFGTSAPELAVSLEASLQGAQDIALGNVVGSNIANIGLILGITALLRPARVEARLVRIDAPLMVGASVLVLLLLADGLISRPEGLVLVLGLAGWIGFTALAARRESDEVRREFAAGAPKSLSGVVIAVLYILAGLVALVLGGRLLIDAAVSIAAAAGVSEAVIGLTVVAVGTSLPEFATSVVAGLRGRGDIAVGNIVGSNLFNLLGILGVAAIVRPLGRGHIDWTTLMVFLAVAVLLFPLLYTRHRLSRPEGALLLAVYGGYVAWLFAGLPASTPRTALAAASEPPVAASSTAEGVPARELAADVPFLVVLGIAQDGGVPQAGSRGAPGWHDPSRRRLVVSLGLVDPISGERWMFEATPDFRLELERLDETFPVEGRPGLNGIFLTHAHIGHYTGLMFLGHESMGAAGVPVYAMPRMRDFLATNGPWNQLVKYENIVLRPLEDGRPVRLNRRLTVTPFLVPHRQEYAEVVGFRIDGPERSALFIPDIDSWEEWDAAGTRIEELLAEVDVAYLDATFFADGEIPGRDMSGFPHPFITHSMERFAGLPAEIRNRVRFIHLNHTNPALWPGSGERHAVEAAGFHVAEPLERQEL
jgi:pyrroloquinoline quinone biosynthesis protein B